MRSVNFTVVDIDIKDFGENFDPSALDSAEDKRKAARKSVLNLLKNTAIQSSQNLKRNAEGYLTTVPEKNNDTLLWPGSKRTKMDKFALTY